MEQEYETETTATQNGRIKQTLFCISNGERIPAMSRFFDTHDEGVKKALIQLGWTPPKESSSSIA